MSTTVDAERLRKLQQLAREGNAEHDPGQEVQIYDVPPPPTGKYSKIYRSAAFQIVIVALLAFSGPGEWAERFVVPAPGHTKITPVLIIRHVRSHHCARRRWTSCPVGCQRRDGGFLCHGKFNNPACNAPVTAIDSVHY